MGAFGLVDVVFLRGDGDCTGLADGLALEALAAGVELAYLVGNLAVQGLVILHVHGLHLHGVLVAVRHKGLHRDDGDVRLYVQDEGFLQEPVAQLRGEPAEGNQQGQKLLAEGFGEAVAFGVLLGGAVGELYLHVFCRRQAISALAGLPLAAVHVDLRVLLAHLLGKVDEEIPPHDRLLGHVDS